MSEFDPTGMVDQAKLLTELRRTLQPKTQQANNGRSRARAEFDAMTADEEKYRQRQIEDCRKEIERVQAQIENLAAEDSQADQFPNGTYVIVGNPRSGQSLVQKDEEGVWWRGGMIATWAQARKVLVQQSPDSVRYVTEWRDGNGNVFASKPEEEATTDDGDTPTNRPLNAEVVRAWAVKKGMNVNATGRISKKVYEAYLKDKRS